MKVIFLDIDGVLNVENYYDSLIFHNQYCNTNIPIRDKYGHVFDPNCVRYLEALCTKHNAKVVISSSWRYSGLKEMIKLFKYRNINIDVIDITVCNASKNFKQQFEELSKLTKIRFSERIDRGYEIQTYLNLNPEITNYVIFDDDSDMLESQKDHYVHCDEMYGIDYRCYQEADEILSNSELMINNNY